MNTQQPTETPRAQWVNHTLDAWSTISALREELVATRDVLHAAVDLLHAQHAELHSLRARYHFLLDERRAARRERAA